MKATILAVTTLGLAAQSHPVPPPLPPSTPGGMPLDAKDHQVLLLGPTTAKAILEHRAVFRDNLAKVKLTPALRARWKAVRTPLTLVAVFGSWCGDSREQLPYLLALEAEPNAFIEVHFLGVYRDMAIETTAWPSGCPAQKVVRVPTFYLFATGPGGAHRLVGTVVENPPRAHQTMAEALVELVEAAAKQG